MTRLGPPSRTRVASRTRRSLARLLLLCLGFAAVTGVSPILSGSARAESSTCPAPGLSVAAGTPVSLASGLTLSAGTVTWGSQRVPLHVVTADLTDGSFTAQTYASTISDAVTVTQAVKATGAVLGVNGDFFHITADGKHLVADGPMGTSSSVVKGWSQAQPVFAITGATAGIDWVHLAGTVTIVQPHPSTGTSVAMAAHVQTGKTKHSTKPPAKKGKKIKKAKKGKKVKKAKKRKKAKRHRRGVHKGPSHPVTAVSATSAGAAAVTATSDSANTTWNVTLDGINDDATTGPTLFTSGWGDADRSLEEPASARELDLSNGTVVRNATSIGSGSPAPGTTALVVSGDSATALASVPIGSTVTSSYALEDDAGNHLSQFIGGNAVLVDQGTVQDPQCTLEGDNAYRPRVSVGVDAAHTRIIVAVSDGDGAVAGLTLHQMAEVMVHLGAVQALNLDGGLSTQLIERSGSTISQVNDNPLVPQRAVSNSLIFLPRG